MQEKRTIRLFILLIVLTAGSVATYIFQQDDHPSVIDPMLFHVEDPAKIDHIVLTSKNKKVDLHIDGTRWVVNNRYDADTRLIDAGGRGIFFATVQQAIAKRAVALHQRDSVNARFDDAGVTVQLFEGPLLQKQFQVGGNRAKTEAYFRIDDTHEPYVMAIPGYRVYVAQVFELAESGWRELRIFNFSWRNFKSLTAKFPADPASDFEISRQGGLFGVAGMDRTDTAKVNTYLDDVSLLAADQLVIPGTSGPFDSLARTTPMEIITVVDIANHSYRLDLFSPLHGEDRIEGTAWDGERVFFDRRKIIGIFRKRNYFHAKQ